MLLRKTVTLVLSCIISVLSFAQQPEFDTARQTEFGTPDLQGNWEMLFATPLQWLETLDE